MKWGLPFSINLFVWGLIGLIRYFEEKIRRKYEPVLPQGEEVNIRSAPWKKKSEKLMFSNTKSYKHELKKVAVCISAKDEGKVIQRTLDSISKIQKSSNCFLISDGSIDKTAEIAKKNKWKVLINKKPFGKARALKKLINHFKLLKKFEFILFVDADTEIDENYLKNAFPLFADSNVACIAAYAKSQWENHYRLSWKYFLISYRARLYKVLQIFLMYGQTWRYTNVLSVVPGFASMYRTSILKRLKIDTPGLAIEDFNLAFQIHKKKLGIIAHSPSVSATAQDPSNFTDYAKQIERWILGFFQTVRHYGIWPSFFWLSLAIFTLEVLSISVFFVFLPIIILLLLFPFLPAYLDPDFIVVSNFFNNFFELWGIIFGIYIVDYLLTFFVAVKDRRPIYLIYGLGFFILRLLDTLIFFATAPRGLFLKSKGVWSSPGRR